MINLHGNLNNRYLLPALFILMSSCVGHNPVDFHDILERQTTYLGVATNNNAYSLEAVYKNGTVSGQDDLKGKFKTITELSGVGIDGRSISLVIDRIKTNEELSPDYAESEFIFRIINGPIPTRQLDFYDCMPFYDKKCRGHSYAVIVGEEPSWCPKDCSISLDPTIDGLSYFGHDDVVLFTSGYQQVNYILTKEVQLNDFDINLIKKECDRLYNKAIKDSWPYERDGAYEIIQKKSLIPEGEESVVSLWMQVRTGSSDPRGSFFILYDRDNKRIIYSTFGHYEWAPESKIKYVRPYLWFKIGKDPRVLILTEKRGAWEDRSAGWSIIEHKTGKLVAHSL